MSVGKVRYRHGRTQSHLVRKIVDLRRPILCSLQEGSLQMLRAPVQCVGKQPSRLAAPTATRRLGNHDTSVLFSYRS